MVDVEAVEQVVIVYGRPSARVILRLRFIEVDQVLVVRRLSTSRPTGHCGRKLCAALCAQLCCCPSSCRSSNSSADGPQYARCVELRTWAEVLRSCVSYPGIVTRLAGVAVREECAFVVDSRLSASGVGARTEARMAPRLMSEFNVSGTFGGLGI